MTISAEQTSVSIPTVTSRGPEIPRSLSIGQQRMWYLAQLAPHSGVYNVPYSSRLRGHLDISATESAFNSIIARHEVLRSVILAPGGKPVPVLLRKWSLPFKAIDLRHLPIDHREAEANRLLMEESARPFNFARDLMLRSMVVQLADEEYLLHHVAPHLAFEGGSVSVLFRDLSSFYSSALKGKPSGLPGLPLQYFDFAAWQQSLLQGDYLLDLSAYWKSQLAGAAQISLPIDYPRPPVNTLRGARLPFVMPPDLLSASRQFFGENAISPYRGLLAVFNILLFAYTGQTDISIGSPFSPRCTGVEDLIGFFVNTVVLRSDLSGSPTFRELLVRINSIVRDAIQHSDLTFDRLVEAIQPPRDPSRGPLFQVNFRAPKEPYPTLDLEGITAEAALYLDNGTSKFDIALEIESSRGEACFFEYCFDLWSKDTVEQMIVDFKLLLRGLITQPDIPFGSVPRVIEIRDRITKKIARSDR